MFSSGFRLYDHSSFSIYIWVVILAIFQPGIECQKKDVLPEERSLTEAANGDDYIMLGEGTLRTSRLLQERGPYFDASASRNVTCLVGKTAHLNCRIRNLGNKTVSWIRHRDLHLLTVAQSTYTSDQRFTAIYNNNTGDWTLKINYPQLKDSGIYECQVSTTPPSGYTMILSVVEPLTFIFGGPELFIDLGSTVNLTCVIKHLPDPPLTVHWMHNNEEISYDSVRGGVSVITEKGDVTTSYLLIQRATMSDSGRYTCLPSNANAKSVYVHVLNGEHLEAIQGSVPSVTSCSRTFLYFLLVVAFSVFAV